MFLWFTNFVAAQIALAQINQNMGLPSGNTQTWSQIFVSCDGSTWFFRKPRHAAQMAGVDPASYTEHTKTETDALRCPDPNQP